ncbi:MAG: hypothetical protein WBF17_25740 [Phycisphaerae bacterium]
MDPLVAEWRLRGIRNLADTLAFRAACCPLATVVTVAEAKFLKPEAHIRLVINPRLSPGEAGHYVQMLPGEDPESRAPVTLIRVVIHFNADLTHKEGWQAGARAVAEELGWIVFFSEAAKRPVVCESEAEERKVVAAFAEEIVSRRIREFEATRPRFSLAKLRDIVRHDLHPASRELEPHLQKLLLGYLGPDGW